MTFNESIKSIMAVKGWNVNEISKRCAYNPKLVYSFLKGEIEPTEKMKERFKLVFDLDTSINEKNQAWWENVDAQ